MAWHSMAKETSCSKAGCYEGQAPPGKNRKLLVAEIQKEYQDILAKAQEASWKFQHFKKYPIRDCQVSRAVLKERFSRPSESRINCSTSWIHDNHDTKSLSNTFLLKALLTLS